METETYCCLEPTVPDNVYITYAPITANPVAKCINCDYQSVYWECACELEHECKENK